jgi:hypothetical protein
MKHASSPLRIRGKGGHGDSTLGWDVPRVIGYWDIQETPLGAELNFKPLVVV